MVYVLTQVLVCTTAGTAITAVFTLDYIVRAKVCTTVAMCWMLGVAS
jgi:hypothetical protein